MIDKRIYKRTPIELNASYTLVESGEVSEVATIINISAEGFCFSSEKKLDKDARVKLAIHINEQNTIQLNVNVVWCNKDEAAGKYRVGAQIIEEIGSDFEKFLIFYCKQAYKSTDK